MAACLQRQTWCLMRKLTPAQTSVASVRWCKWWLASSRKKKKPETDASWANPLLDWPEEKRQLQEREPSPLHMVVRLYDLKGVPKNEKEVAMVLGFGEGTKKLTKVLLRNTPNINSDLKIVQHLVRITPVTFPYGLPESEEDWEHCYLRDNGEFIIRRKIPNGEESLPTDVGVTPDRDSSVWDMDKETIKKQNDKKLAEYDLNSEFFKPQYVYKHNQDGKEHRYFGDKRFGGKGRTWY